MRRRRSAPPAPGGVAARGGPWAFRRRSRGASAAGRWAFRGLFGALVGAQVGYSALPEARRVAATRGIVGLMLTTSLVESALARGARRGPALVVTAGGIGFAAEVLGVATGRPFGHYHYSGRLGPRVAGVPLLAAAAWAMMARPAWAVAGSITRRRPARAALAAGALTAWDVFLDPRMAREGYWTWPEGGAYEGVPLQNFAGWFTVGGVVFAVWALAESGEEPPAEGDGALALYAWTWLGETFANAAIWRRPRVALAGSAAMGAFAVPALLARVRGRPRRAARPRVRG